jgi:hypothetical protein
LELKENKKFLGQRKWPLRDPIMLLGLLARSKQRLISIHSVDWVGQMNDKSVFYTAFLNCFWPDGGLNRTRTWREVRFLGRFLSSLLAVIILFLAICATPIVLVHSYVVPIPIALKIFGSYHLDPAVWEHNIEDGDVGDVGAEYEAWSKERGFSKRTAKLWQYFLWYTWPFLIGYALYSFALFYLFIDKFSRALWAYYKKKVFRREVVYYVKSCSRESKPISG